MVKIVATSRDKPHGLAFESTGVTYINEWSGNRILKDDGRFLRSSGRNP